VKIMLLVTSVAALAYTTSKPTDTHALRPEGVWASQYSAGSIAGLNNISYYQYAVAQQTTPALMPILSSTWGNCHSLQSCDLSTLASDASVTNSASLTACAAVAGVDGIRGSTVGTCNDAFVDGFGAWYSVPYDVRIERGVSGTIQCVIVYGRILRSYNSKYYSTLLGNFDVYVGQKSWSITRGPTGQTLCYAHRGETPSDFQGTFVCDEAVLGVTPSDRNSPFLWVTVVLRPDDTLVGFDARKLPKDSRPFEEGGFANLACGGGCPHGCVGSPAECACGCDVDNPTVITAADSGRFLVIGEIEAYGNPHPPSPPPPSPPPLPPPPCVNFSPFFDQVFPADEPASLPASRSRALMAKAVAQPGKKVNAQQEAGGASKCRLNENGDLQCDGPVDADGELPPLRSLTSSVWSLGIQSCDLSMLSPDATVTDAPGKCSETSSIDGKVGSTIGTDNDPFVRAPNGEYFGAFNTISYHNPGGSKKIYSVWVQGRSIASYNAEVYSQVLGDFDIYVGVEGWTYESVVNGAFLSRQKLCTTNRQSTAAPGFGRNFVCDDANGVEGTFVTIVLRPMTETNLKHGFPFIAKLQPKDARYVRGGGKDNDNPTAITEPRSPRFLVVAEVAACAA